MQLDIRATRLADYNNSNRHNTQSLEFGQKRAVTFGKVLPRTCDAA
jgi:hypothetical protein